MSRQSSSSSSSSLERVSNSITCFVRKLIDDVARHYTGIPVLYRLRQFLGLSVQNANVDLDFPSLTYGRGSLFSWLRINGDDLFEVFLLLSLVIVVAIYYLHPKIFSDMPRYILIIILATSMDIANHILTKFPWYLVTSLMMKGKVLPSRLVLLSAAISVNLGGSMFYLRRNKLIPILFLAFFSHAPDIMAGILLSKMLDLNSGPYSLKNVTPGSVAGGSNLSGRARFPTSGLTILTNDNLDLDKTAFYNDSDVLYMPRQPMEMYHLTSTEDNNYLKEVQVSKWPVFKLTYSEERFPRNNTLCKTKDPSEEMNLTMSARRKDNSTILMRITYNSIKARGTGVPSFDHVYKLQLTLSEVLFRKGNKGTDVIQVTPGEGPLQELDELPAIENLEHNMCQAFLNALTYSVHRNNAKLQSQRVAVAWVVRSATENTVTGLKEDHVRKALVRNPKLVYFPHIILVVTYCCITLSSLLIGTVMLVFNGPFSRSLETMTSLLGGYIFQHTLSAIRQDTKILEDMSDTTGPTGLTLGLLRKENSDNGDEAVVDGTGCTQYNVGQAKTSRVNCERDNMKKRVIAYVINHPTNVVSLTRERYKEAERLFSGGLPPN